MKKSILMLSVFFSFGSIAQNTSFEQDSEPTFHAGPKAKKGISNQKSAAPFYTEDFGAGFPAGWAIQDTSGICPWTYSMDGSWGNFNGNSATSAGTGINSTTATNGFLICDIDSANHFTYGQPSGSNYQYLSSYFTTSPIDCSSHGSVVLKFEQFFRFNNGVSMNVSVSNDSINWTNFNVSGGVANNATPANPTEVVLNITSVAANQSTVYLRFGWSARVYYWMIDDISLSELDAFDLSADDSWWAMGALNYQYYKTPLSHAGPITFLTSLTNNSTSALAGSSVLTDISGTSGSVFTGSSTPINLPVAMSDTVASSTTWTPTTIGMYNLTAMASSTSGVDDNPVNNNFIDSLQITASTFGLDNLSSGSQSTGSISNFSSNTGSPFKIGNLYEVTIDDAVECVQVGIADNTQNVDKEIFVEVYAYDINTGDYVYRGNSDNHRITAAELGTIITLEMVQFADVYAGEEILVVAGHFGGNSSGSDDVSFMYGQSVPSQTVYGYNANGDLFFLSNPRAIVIRPNFDCSSIFGLSEINQTIDARVFPNPAKDELTVRLGTDVNSGTITLTDISGRVVLTKELKPNDMDISIDVTEIAGGMYTVRIQSDKGAKTIQVAVKH